MLLIVAGGTVYKSPNTSGKKVLCSRCYIFHCVFMLKLMLGYIIK